MTKLYSDADLWDAYRQRRRILAGVREGRE